MYVSAVPDGEPPQDPERGHRAGSSPGSGGGLRAIVAAGPKDEGEGAQRKAGPKRGNPRKSGLY